MKDLKRYTDFIVNKTEALLNIDSPTGYTDAAAAWVKAEFEQLGFAARYTNKGGVIVDLCGAEAGNGLLLEAHADTLGGMVREITSQGRLKITNVGGLRATSVETENCRVYTRFSGVYSGT